MNSEKYTIFVKPTILPIIGTFKYIIYIPLLNYQTGADMNNTSIGSLIKAELERQERSVVWLARHLCCDRTNIYRIFAKESIDTELLMRISIVLNHNFFKDISSAIDEQLLQK